MKLKGIVFDLDNTLYQDPAAKNQIYAQAAARAFRHFCPNITDEECSSISSRSFQSHGNDIELFWHEGGYRQEDVHARYHHEAFALFRHIIKPLEGLRDCFNELAGKIELAVLTHSSTQWAEDILDLIQLKDHFPSNRIFGLDHPGIGFKRKNNSEIPFRIVAQALKMDPVHLGMMDDLEDNLHIPKKLGFYTIHTHWQPLEPSISQRLHECSKGPLPFLKSLKI